MCRPIYVSTKYLHQWNFTRFYQWPIVLKSCICPLIHILFCSSTCCKLGSNGHISCTTVDEKHQLPIYEPAKSLEFRGSYLPKQVSIPMLVLTVNEYLLMQVWFIGPLLRGSDSIQVPPYRSGLMTGFPFLCIIFGLNSLTDQWYITHFAACTVQERRGLTILLEYWLRCRVCLSKKQNNC